MGDMERVKVLGFPQMREAYRAFSPKALALLAGPRRFKGNFE